MTSAKIIMVRRAWVVPMGLGVVAAVVSALVSPWWLFSIPFVIIGAVFTAPNLNLADGFLSYLSMVIGLIVTCFQAPSGLAMLVGTVASFLGSALEMRVRAKPYQAEHERP